MSRKTPEHVKRNKKSEPMAFTTSLWFIQEELEKKAHEKAEENLKRGRKGKKNE